MSVLSLTDRLTADRRWLNQQQAADYLGVTDRTIRLYIARGALRAHRIRSGRGIRIDIADLDALMEPLGGDSA